MLYRSAFSKDWHPNLIQLEAAAKEECEVLLFVIDSKTRAIASMLEATEYIMQQRKVVLVILDIPGKTTERKQLSYSYLYMRLD